MLFDPDTGAVLNRQDLKSIQLAGFKQSPASKIVEGKKVTEVLSENDGSVGGYRIEHNSGRVDANVVVKAPSLSQNQGVS
jgi:flavin-dependent dehydrogenase